MKSIIAVCSVVAFFIGVVATYFVARPKTNRHKDWKNISTKTKSGWSIATSKVTNAKNAIFDGHQETTDEARTA